MPNARVRTQFVAGALLAAGCGGSTAEPSAAPTGSSSPGERCLADATAPRTPKPDAPPRIALSHILVRHAELKRPPPGMTRSREQACLRAIQALEALQAGTELSAVVAEYSDAKSGADDVGSLGRVSHDELRPSVADAAFALDVDQVSYVVESESGFHVLIRTE